MIILKLFSQCSLPAANIFILAAVSLPWLFAEVTMANTATRKIVDQPSGVSIQVQADPNPGILAYSVEEQLPPNFAARSISDDGFFDHYTGKVKWGPFVDDLPRTLVYHLVSSVDTAAILNGRACFDKDDFLLIQGEAEAMVVVGGMDSWLLRKFGGGVFTRPESRLEDDSDVDGYPTIAEFYFGLDPESKDENPIRIQMEALTERVSLVFDPASGVSGVELRLRETTDLSEWDLVKSAPIIQDMGNGFERVTYQLPAVQTSRIIDISLEWISP